MHKSDLQMALNVFRKRNLDAGIVAMKALHPKYSSILLDENNFVISLTVRRSRVNSLALRFRQLDTVCPRWVVPM
jgi:hypothetical protein